ncbi:MAG: DsrE family protein [Desulfobulbaceae bacterium]|nr:DsrE family protein [Desulfobulbaceae bacterium]
MLVSLLETEPICRKQEEVMKKVVLVTYNPEMMCFAHVLLYAIDFHEKGYDTKVVIEGGAVKLVSVLKDAEAPFYSLYEKVKQNGLIDCVCRACSAKLGSLEDAEAQGLRVHGDLMGHPSIEAYLNQGYQLITF